LMDALQGLCCKNDCNIVQIDAAKQFDMTQTVWCEKSSKMGCTIIKITQFNENEFDANCNCLSCKHQMKTKSNRSSHKYTEYSNHKYTKSSKQQQKHLHLQNLYSIMIIKVFV